MNNNRIGKRVCEVREMGKKVEVGKHKTWNSEKLAEVGPSKRNSKINK